MPDELQKSPGYLDDPVTRFDFGEEKWGVLFLNMGGPETIEDVGSYLYNIFSDRRLIKLPVTPLLQRPLARLIASRRAPKVARRYQMIGGGSPLLKWTRLAASGVERELSKRYPHVEVFVGMRYAEPYIEDELEAAVGEGCRHLVVFSMYPHYCEVTTGSSLAEVADWLEDTEADMTVSLIDHWHDRPEYISLMRKHIEEAFEKVQNPATAKLLFSAHAIPQKVVDKGDPYVTQIKETVAMAGEGYDYTLAFQSRTGPVKWVGPDTIETVRRMAREGVTEIVVMPVSFVSDHIETLYEIDIELKEIALAAGITSFVRVESFNDNLHFTAFLADLIEEKIQGVQAD